jgi:hypothetical protein
MPSLDGGPMEKLGVSITLFEPLDAGLLPPQDFFLGFSFLQLLSDCLFL